LSRHQRDRNFTVLVIPHNDSVPISFSLPRWLLPSLLVLIGTLLLVTAYFVVRYQRLAERYEQLAQEQQIEFERSHGMRSTILTQQDDVKALSNEVKQIQAELEGIRKLDEQVRQLLGLPKAPPAPMPMPSATPQSSLIPNTNGRGGGLASPNSETPPSMLLVAETIQQAQSLRPTIAWSEKELQYLANQALVRLSKIDPSQRVTQDQLETQLRLLAAAPTLWPARGTITSRFGWRTALFNPNAREFHSGLDLGVWYFTPVKATKDGTVIYAGWLGGYGNAVEIAHEQGYTTLYGHNYSLKVSAGQRVKAGEVIALSGQTGYASGPHIHYEVRLYGKPLDPLRFLDLSP
jgi:murein DD-endopeptidase MepM/ murein hydrolase activator NlpD